MKKGDKVELLENIPHTRSGHSLRKGDKGVISEEVSIRTFTVHFPNNVISKLDDRALIKITKKPVISNNNSIRTLRRKQ